MSGFRFPNESDEYRAKREELLEMEMELRELVDAVSAKRRELPLGGRLARDYRFEQVGEDGELREVSFGELFGEHRSLLLYTMMYGADWDAPCPSCTSLVDAFNANHHPVSQHCAFAVVGAASARQFHDGSRRRGWRLPVYSAGKSTYVMDCFASDAPGGSAGASADPSLASMMNCFCRTDEGIFHTWGSELVRHPKANGHPSHVDTVWPFWNLLDMTPEGRGDACVPKQDFEHAYFTRHVFPGGG